MKESAKAVLDNLISRYPALGSIQANLEKTVETLAECYRNGGKLLICGNGGSASDSLHIVGELLKDFAFPRPLDAAFKAKLEAFGEDGRYMAENLQGALPTIALVGSSSIESAYANDRAPDLAFAQQVNGLGKEGDVLLAITTSGNSRNVIYASEVAKAKGLGVIALTGLTGGKMKDHCDILLNVPAKEPYLVQELHLPVYHAICLALEEEFFG